MCGNSSAPILFNYYTSRGCKTLIRIKATIKDLIIASSGHWGLVDLEGKALPPGRTRKIREKETRP